MRKLCLVITLLFCVMNVFCQNRFFVTIQLPENIDSSKLMMAYDDGKAEMPIKRYKTNRNHIEISEIFYGRMAAIILRYPKSINSQYQNSFFVSVKPARIELDSCAPDASPFDKYKLTNAFDFKKDKEGLLDNDAEERKMISGLLMLDSQRNDHSEDSVLSLKLNLYNVALLEKDLTYLLKNNNSYYSFWFFRRNIVPASIRTADSLLFIFNSKFPKEFKETEEGNTIRKRLFGRMALEARALAPLFTSQAIGKKKIVLSEFRGKRNVLIVFWATWCKPCLHEIPIIKQIRDKYSEKDLEIIYVGYPSDYSTYLSFIKQKKMNWTHIYNDIDLINAYGGYKAIPRIYLINTSGKIIYNKDVDDLYDEQLKNLKDMLESIIPKPIS
ncbi:MAG: TlpA disulfide reductase family protein [Bacteroidota bacterium]|nr:TlpA disulfide reductase family protein [Bacteroidota bacterium]